MEKNPNYQNCCIHEKGSYNFKWIRCINAIYLLLFELSTTEPVNNQNSVKMEISRTLSDLYIQEWNEEANVSSRGKQYLLLTDNLNFEKYLINVSKFYYSKIIKYRISIISQLLLAIDY